MAGRFEATVVVDRPIDEVFAFLADGENDPKFSPRVLEINKTSEGPPRGRNHLRQHRQGRRHEDQSTSSRSPSSRPPTRIRWAELFGESRNGRGGGYDLAREGEGTRVTIHNVLEGHGDGQASRPARASRGPQRG